MKRETLQVGIRGFSVSVDVDIPENLGEVAKLAKGSDSYIVSKFIRGYRIDLQEGGARQLLTEMVAGKDGAMLKNEKFKAEVREAVLKEIQEFNPDTPRSRGGRPKKPVVVELPKGKKSFSAEEVQALLQSKGIITQ